MKTSRQHGTWILGNGLRVPVVGLALSIVLVLTIAATQAAQAQTYTVIHDFSGPEGSTPYAGLTPDRSGALYGTTSAGGSGGFGNIFKLVNRGGGWTINPIQSFNVRERGQPWAPVTIDPDGSLSGTLTSDDQGEQQCGGFFTGLRPAPRIPASLLAPWPAPSGLYGFSETGACTPYSGVIFDPAGNIYGTAVNGFGGGTVYQLTYSDGRWTETDLQTFSGAIYSDVILDDGGNLYGTAYADSGHEWGSVFQLVPSGSDWILNTLYTFQNGSDGRYPTAGLIFDDSGNLFGATSIGGSGGGGTVFELTPNGDGTYTFNLLHSFNGSGDYWIGPWDSLTMDASHNLYGTTVGGGSYNRGLAFVLSPSGSGWIYTTLHDFTGGSDGQNPFGRLVPSGNTLFGTAVAGGANDRGVIFQIMP